MLLWIRELRGINLGSIFKLLTFYVKLPYLFRILSVIKLDMHDTASIISPFRPFLGPAIVIFGAVKSTLSQARVAKESHFEQEETLSRTRQQTRRGAST